MTTTRRITAEVPDRTRIAEVQAAMTDALDHHAIVDNVGGSGQVIVFDVTFAHDAEVAGLVHAATIAALHVTPCEVKS